MPRRQECEREIRSAMLASFREAWPDYVSPIISDSAVKAAGAALKSKKTSAELECKVLCTELVDNETAVLMAFGVKPPTAQFHTAFVCMASDPQVARHKGAMHDISFIRKGQQLTAANG